MALTPSTMLPLGTTAPDFALPDTVSGKVVRRDDFAGKKGLLVVFLCNHCPYVKHVAEGLAKLTSEYQAKGVGVVGISPNDVAGFPADGPELMKAEAAKQGYAFPYLYDETQAVAKAYRAACTPDFFLFDAAFKLYYRGQMDASRPRVANILPVTGEDLRKALDALLAGAPAPEPQTPSVGCNIKWIPGQEPDYFAK